MLHDYCYTTIVQDGLEHQLDETEQPPISDTICAENMVISLAENLIQMVILARSRADSFNTMLEIISGALKKWSVRNLYIFDIYFAC